MGGFRFELVFNDAMELIGDTLGFELVGFPTGDMLGAYLEIFGTYMVQNQIWPFRIRIAGGGICRDIAADGEIGRMLRREKSFCKFFRKVFRRFREVFQNFRKFFEDFASFSRFSDPFGPIRMHSDAFGSNRKRLDIFEKF